MIKYFIGDIYNSQIWQDFNGNFKIVIPNELYSDISENNIELLYGKDWKTKMYIKEE